MSRLGRGEDSTRATFAGVQGQASATARTGISRVCLMRRSWAPVSLSMAAAAWTIPERLATDVLGGVDRGLLGYFVLKSPLPLGPARNDPVVAPLADRPGRLPVDDAHPARHRGVRGSLALALQLRDSRQILLSMALTR